MEINNTHKLMQFWGGFWWI